MTKVTFGEKHTAWTQSIRDEVQNNWINGIYIPDWNDHERYSDTGSK